MANILPFDELNRLDIEIRERFGTEDLKKRDKREEEDIIDELLDLFLHTGEGEINSNGNTLSDFADAMEKACKKWHLPFINLNQIVGWNPNNIASFVTAETSGNAVNYIHPKSEGGARMANWISGSLLNCKIN